MYRVFRRSRTIGHLGLAILLCTSLMSLPAHAEQAISLGRYAMFPVDPSLESLIGDKAHATQVRIEVWKERTRTTAAIRKAMRGLGEAGEQKNKYLLNVASQVATISTQQALHERREPDVQRMLAFLSRTLYDYAQNGTAQARVSKRSSDIPGMVLVTLPKERLNIRLTFLAGGNPRTLGMPVNRHGEKK